MRTVYFIVTVVLNFWPGNCDLTQMTFAGNKSYTECTRGFQMSDLDISVAQFIKQEGYPVEEHAVITEDGYVLTMQRVPGGPGSSPIFMQHGILTSSFDYVFSGKNESIVFFLADAGYDVWLGNFRGTPYSMCHTKYVENDFRYWNFSFHEQGKYDLPAQISYIMDTTNQNIIYLGHSMACTTFYVMVDQRPDIVSKIKLFIGFSPIVYLYYTRSLVEYFTSIAPASQLLFDYLTAGKLNFQIPLWKYFVDHFCGLSLFTEKICMFSIFAFSGFNQPEFEYNKTVFLLHHYPTSVSMRTLNHYAQVILTEQFRHFHLGTERNLVAYNSTLPPKYNMSKVAIPTGVVWSDNDYLTDRRDMLRFFDSIPTSHLVFNIKMKNFIHFDYLWGKHARELLYTKILPFINKYR